MRFLEPARLLSVMSLGLIQAASGGFAQTPGDSKPLEKSAYFAFVDREFIFTIEVVKPGVPLFNFISLVDQEHNIQAKQVRLSLENRKVPGKFFLVDTGDPKEPLIVPSVRMRPRSSFGVRLEGEFGAENELIGATVQIGSEDFKLAPLSSFDYEKLAMKVNRINLSSPDLREDWRVLKLEMLGTRERARPTRKY